MKSNLIPVGGFSEQEDGSRHGSLDSRAVKNVDLSDLVLLSREDLPGSLLQLLGEEAPQFLVFGKAMEKTRKNKGRGPKSIPRPD